MYGKSILLMEPRLNLCRFHANTNVLKSLTIIILITTTTATTTIIIIIIISGSNSSSIMKQLLIVNISIVPSCITFFPKIKYNKYIYNIQYNKIQLLAKVTSWTARFVTITTILWVCCLQNGTRKILNSAFARNNGRTSKKNWVETDFAYQVYALLISLGAETAEMTKSHYYTAHHTHRFYLNKNTISHFSCYLKNHFTSNNSFFRFILILISLPGWIIHKNYYSALSQDGFHH